MSSLNLIQCTTTSGVYVKPDSGIISVPRMRNNRCVIWAECGPGMAQATEPYIRLLCAVVKRKPPIRWLKLLLILSYSLFEGCIKAPFNVFNFASSLFPILALVDRKSPLKQFVKHYFISFWKLFLPIGFYFF